MTTNTLTNLEKKQKVYFSKSLSETTLENWTGGTSYKGIFSFELFGIKLVIWKKI